MNCYTISCTVLSIKFELQGLNIKFGVASFFREIKEIVDALLLFQKLYNNKQLKNQIIIHRVNVVFKWYVSSAPCVIIILNWLVKEWGRRSRGEPVTLQEMVRLILLISFKGTSDAHWWNLVTPCKSDSMVQYKAFSWHFTHKCSPQ